MPDINPQSAVHRDVPSTRTSEEPSGVVSKSYTRELTQAHELLPSQLESMWSLLKRRIAAPLAVLLLVFSWFVVDSLKSTRVRLDELQRMDEQIKLKGQELSRRLATSKLEAQHLQSTYAGTRALEETLGELRAAREAVGLDRALVTPEQLRRAALNFEPTKLQVRARYLARGAAGPQYERFGPSVMFEAVDTYVALVMSGTHDGLLAVTGAERTELLAALAYTLANLVDNGDPGVPGHAQLLLDRRVRDMLVFVAADADAPQKRALIRELTEALSLARAKRPRENIALSLAELGERTVLSLDVLSEMQNSKRPWRAAFGAMRLAKLGLRRGYDNLAHALQQDEGTAYPAASLLAELGDSGMSALSKRLQVQAQLPQLRADVERVLRAYDPRNCLEERYARHLLTCLNGPCRALSDDESCPIYSARE